MSDLWDWIDAEAERVGYKNDAELARAIGVSNGTLSNARYVCAQGVTFTPGRECRRPSILASMVEIPVWDYVSSLISADDVIARAREIGRDRIDADETGKRLAEIDAELARLNAKIDGLLERFGDDDTLADNLTRKIDDIKARVSALATERETLTCSANEAEYQRIAVDALEAQLSKIRKLLKSPTVEVKRKILEAVELKAVVIIDDMGRRWADVETLLGGARLPLVKPNQKAARD